MSVWGKVAGKRKTFLSLLCDGVPPYDACRQVWPRLKDVHGHVTAIFDDPDFIVAYARLTDYQFSRERLLAQCLSIIESKTVANDDRLAAIRVAAMLKGYIKQGVANRNSPKSKLVPIEENQLLEKMAELGRKAYKGSEKKPD